MNGTARDLLLGLAYIGCCLLLALGSIAAYERVFADDVTVTVRAGDIGNALRQGSDVKYQGVVVGRVATVEPTTGGADLSIAIDRDRAATIPGDSVVQMLPETLFGERYVSLVSTSTTAEPLRDGDVLTQDTSAEALQVQDLFDALLPVLTAVRPDKINATLGELATALRGHGAAIGDALVDWSRYVRELNPHLPTIARDLDLFGDVARTYADAAPDLLAALDDLTTTSRTVAESRDQLDALFRTVTSASATTSQWLETNEESVVRLSATSRRVLTVLARYAPEFPCLARAVAGLVPRVDRMLGAGTDRPGLHVTVTVVDHRAPYRSGASLRADGDPRCPTSDGGVRPVAVSRTNTTQESQMVRELVAIQTGEDPEALPTWSSLVVGPALRGAEVGLR